MSNLELHQYLPQLPEAVLQEFIEWCMLEQSTAAGLEFKPDQSKLKNFDCYLLKVGKLLNFQRSLQNWLAPSTVRIMFGLRNDGALVRSGDL